jgi:hypothetical protein
MTMPMPPQLEAAYAQVGQALSQAHGQPLDLAAAPWADVEKAVIKVLGGRFDVARPEHQVVALGLSAGLAERLHASSQAFFFPFRETPEGASLGFPDALVMLSPFGAVVDALRAAKLERLNDVEKEIRTALAQVKFSAAGGGAPLKLAPEDYMRLFDPGFVQLVAVDPVKAKQTWDLTPGRLSVDVRDAIGRASKLPPEVRKQLESQLVGALARLDAGKPILGQVARSPRLVESMALLFASTGGTGAAAEEFWSDVVMPLLFVGAPASFPPLEAQELDLAKQGVDPLFLFLEVVPYQHQAPDDEGLLGAFPAASLSLPDPAFQGLTQVRLIKVDPATVRPALAQFDAQKTRDAVARFTEALKAKLGGALPVGPGAEEAKAMLDAALTLLDEVRKLFAGGKDVYVRRLTEAEASSEPALAQVRQAASGPRIILAP